MAERVLCDVRQIALLKSVNILMGRSFFQRNYECRSINIGTARFLVAKIKNKNV